MSRTISEAVVVEIRINRSGEVESAVDNLSRKGVAGFGALGSAVATVTKALLSMAAVIVVWTAFITIPEAIASSLKKLAVLAIESADEMQRQILNTAGLLASFATFGPTVAESFGIAARASEKLLIQFAGLASKSVASATDIQLAFQTLVSRGGLSFTKDLSEAATLAGTLTNIVVSLTGGLNKERQIVSEISALFEGQARTGAVVAKIVKAQVGDLDTWLNKMKAAGPGALNEALKQMFSGIDQASNALGQTIGGMIASIEGNLKILNRIVQQAGGGFQVIINWLREWRDLLADAVLDIGQVNNGFQSLQPKTQAILYAMAEFSVATGIILQMIDRIAKALLGANTQLEMVQQTGYGIVRVAVIVSGLVDVLIQSLTILKNEAMIIIEAMDAAMNPGKIPAFLKSFQERLDAIAVAGVKLGTALDFKENMTVARQAADKQLANMAELLKKLGEESNWIKLNKAADEEATDAIRKKILELQRALELAQANGNPFAAIWIKAKHDIAEAVIEMKKAPAELALAKRLITETAQITEANLLSDQNKNASLALARVLYGDMAALLMEQKIIQDQITEAHKDDTVQLNQAATAYSIIAGKQIELLQHQQAVKFRSDEEGMLAQIHQLDSGGDRALAIQDQYIESLQRMYTEWHVGSKELPALIRLLDRLTEAQEKALDRTRFFESIDTLINSERILRDDITETIRLMGIGTASAMMLSGGYDAIRKNLDLLQDKLNDNAFAIAALNAQKGLSIEQDQKVIAKQRELNAESNKIKTIMSDTVSAIRQMQDATSKLSDVIGNLIVRVGTLHQSLRAAFVDELPGLLKSVGQLGADALTGAIQGTEKFGAALKKSMAQEITALGTRTIAQGLANVAQGIWPFNPVQLGAGAKQIAAGAAIVALANKLSPAASSAPSTSGASGGGQQSQTILLTPFGYNPTTALVKTLDNLNATVDRLNTMPAGVVVADGMNDPKTAQVVTKSVSNTLQGDQQTRTEMNKTLAGVS